MGLGCYGELAPNGHCGNCDGNHKTTEQLERDLKEIQEELDKRYLLNRGTTASGQEKAAKMSAAYARARAKKHLPTPVPPPIEPYEEDIIARLKTRRRSVRQLSND